MSVIIPTISNMGIQVCSLPTAVLSTHTGGLGDFIIEDLSSFVIKTLKHYRDLKIDFSCIYTGFLSSEKQFDYCLEYFNQYNNSFLVVDPVMGDNGKIYKTYTESMKNRMKDLVIRADLITPNITEASILLNKKYPKNLLEKNEIKKWLLELTDLGPRYAIITGIKIENGKIGNFAYDKFKKKYFESYSDYFDISYPGTGDIFTSIIVASMLNQNDINYSLKIATKFLEIVIKDTYENKLDKRYGVLLEKNLKYLYDIEV